MIRIENLHKKFGDLEVLKGIDAEIGKGEVISIIGPSGCGKSTFLRCMNLLEQPTSGRIFVGDEEITAPRADASKIRRRMNMVFQSFNLFNHLTVLENLTIGPQQLLGKSEADARARAESLLHTVGLAERMHHLPDELSGGQKQRVAIARCVAMEPEVILFDEPTSALDPTMVSEVLAVIRNLASQGLTMLLVTHEMAFAREASSRIFFMHEGRIHEQGPPAEIFDRPSSPLTRAFIQRVRSHVVKVASAEVDIFAIHGGLERFCERHLIAREVAMRLDLAAEEIIALLVPAIDRIGPFELIAEYSEVERTLSLSVTLPEGFENPFGDGSEAGDGGEADGSGRALNLRVLKHTSHTMEVTPGAGNYTVRVRIRAEEDAPQ